MRLKNTVQLTINGRVLDARDGQTILEAAREGGIAIPTLCHHPDLSPDGSCRLCMVEIDGWRGQVASCTQPVSQGMVVHTATAGVEQSRRDILELMLLRYADAGYTAGTRPETEFMRQVRECGVQLPDGPVPTPRFVVDSDPNPVIRMDLNKCIQCSRCIRACAEVQGRLVWSKGLRGDEARIVSGANTTMLDAGCESCGACAAYCPTGALDDKPSIRAELPDRLVTTTCGYCGVGCQFDLNVKDNRIVRVTSNPTAPVNGMALCVKGRYGYDFVHHPDRLTRPRVRSYLLAGDGQQRPASGRGEWVEVDWDTALDLVARKLSQIKRETGPDAIGVLSSAKCTNEENYLLQKFARQVIGTHNVDHCARLCHASTVAGLAMCYGSGAMSNTMADIAEHAQAMLIIGTNTTEQHPVFGAQIRQAVLRRGVKLVVADPRQIDMVDFATLHIRQRPGTDVAFVNGIMHLILRNQWEAQDFIDHRCEGFDEFRATMARYTPEIVAEITGVSVADLERAAELLAVNSPMAVFWAMGITQHTTGVMNVLSLGNLQMLLGNMGKPGGGVNPLRGQNNVQGACDMGALPNVFTGYQAVTDEKMREKFAAAWALESGTGDSAAGSVGFASSPGLASTEMIPLARTGKVRALYVVGEDPMLTDPDLNHAHECLEACEFIVLQDIFPTVTSEFADVLLPATSFAEKDGTFTNTERRVQLVRKAIDAPGEARPDWAITMELARRVLALEGRVPTGPRASWTHEHPAEIMAEIAALTPSYAGVSHARLERGENLHWPIPDIAHPGTPILHIGQFTRGKGKFHAIDHLPPHELPDAQYPMVLTTGRVLYHWHGGEMTRRAHELTELYPESLIEVSPDDAARLGLKGKTKVRLRSRRGEMVAHAIVTDRVSPGLVFGNFHFPGAQNVNYLTIEALDPVAKIPEYKVCAVQIEVIADA